MVGHRPVLIVVRDGWGVRAERAGNAVALARTPRHDEWLARFPAALVQASSSYVGLPDQQMGSSEVGHLTMGAGRIIEHDLVRVDRAVATGELGRTALREAIQRAQERDRALHLVGLCSDGGVHSRLAHLRALLELARDAGVAEVHVHAITDGRDADPHAGVEALRRIVGWTRELGTGRLASVSGRYYAMDRDRRWERTKAAWETMVHGRGARADDAIDALERSHAAGKGDEFVPPTTITQGGRPVGLMRRGDQTVVFNFRGDRMRQLCAALGDPGFDGFDRGDSHVLELATMTSYDAGLPVRGVAFPPQVVATHLSAIVAGLGRSQFKCAETEKYPHVTSFWNGGLEEPCPGEARALVPSPRVATYDVAPEMSARAVADATLARLRDHDDALLVVNFANADMVGHTGVLDATVRAVETLDEQVGRVVDAVLGKGGAALVTADHGNCELMVDPATGRPHTAHTTNPVHAIVCDPRAAARRARQDGCTLADVAPTALELLELERPACMTGRSVLVPA